MVFYWMVIILSVPKKLLDVFADTNSQYRLSVEHISNIWNLGAYEDYLSIGILNSSGNTRLAEIAIPYTNTGIISYRGLYVGWTKIKS